MYANITFWSICMKNVYEMPNFYIFAKNKYMWSVNYSSAELVSIVGIVCNSKYSSPLFGSSSIRCSFINTFTWYNTHNNIKTWINAQIKISNRHNISTNISILLPGIWEIRTYSIQQQTVESNYSL